MTWSIDGVSKWIVSREQIKLANMVGIETGSQTSAMVAIPKMDAKTTWGRMSPYSERRVR